MSWDVVLFNSKQKIISVEDLEVNQLEPTDFCSILESSFPKVIIDNNHREIKGKDFSIDYFIDEEPVSNKILSLYGENALFRLVELSREFDWQIFDTGLDKMIDLEKSHQNGFDNHQERVKQIMKK
ncbi:MAG: hypothetical protein HEP71_24840 [Roseivirga sp.]|nr:hypothetical protein [Roseivirga sp.]